MNVVATISSADASLPQNYEAAKQALQRTVDMDECLQWADKAMALASYARQAKDESLEKMSIRVRGRAIRRAGELLREIERPSQGGRPPKNGDGTDPVSRKSAAEAAGMSERQRKTAIKVAKIPEDDFEDAIESDDPPTVTKLAYPNKESPIGETAVRNLWGDSAADDPEAFKAATHISAAITDLANLYQTSPPAGRVIAVMSDQERAELRRSLIALSSHITDTMEALS